MLHRSVVSDSFEIPWTVAFQAPLSMEFFRQRYWSGLPFPTPGNFPNPGMEPVSPALANRFFTTAPLKGMQNKILQKSHNRNYMNVGFTI